MEAPMSDSPTPTGKTTATATRTQLLRKAEAARRACQQNKTARGRYLARERYLDAISALRHLDALEAQAPAADPYAMTTAAEHDAADEAFYRRTS